MKILNKEINFDLDDAENIDRAIELDKKYADKLEKAKTITDKCKVYKEFFDELIGEGTSKELFGNKNKIFDITDAYQDIIKEAERINTEAAKKAANIKRKYERYK